MSEKSNRSFFCICVILILVLVPILQTLPSNLMQPQTASATGTIVLNGTKTTSGTISSSPFQITLSNFNVGTSSNRLLVVGVEAHGQGATSITFGGVSLTKAVSSFVNNDAEFWYLTNPSGTGNIVVTMGGSTSVVVGAYSFFGVNQTNPIPTTNTNHDICLLSCPQPTISITTQYQNSWVLDSPAIYGGKTLSSPTCTQQWNINIPNEITGASSSTIQASPGSVTCSWTASGGSDLWDDVAIELQAAGGTVPGAPTGLTATAVSSSQINLSWTAPSNNGSSAITGYKIERSTDGGSTWSTIVSNTGNTNTSYSDTGLAHSTTYTYRVSAINSVGTGSPSNTASATTFNTVPSAPTNPTSTATSTTQIKLGWTAPSDNGGTPITGYHIQRASASWVNVINNTGTTVTNYNVTSLAANSAYKFRIAAWNGIGLGAYSSNVTGYTLPSAPSSLTATAVSSSQINLSWAAPGGNATISGYKIERSTDGGSTWSTLVANTGNTNTTYSDTGLAGSTTYTYRVSTINGGGTSTPSNTASATTQASSSNIVLNGTNSISGTVKLTPYKLTLSNFNVGTSSNRLLVVGVEASSNGATSITFGGVSLTKAVSSFHSNDAELWYLKNPNGTGNIVVTMNGLASVVVGAYSFFGVDQTNPIPTTAIKNGTGAGSPTISITTANPNSWVIDSPAIYGGVTLSSPTCTSRWNDNVQDTVTGKITGASSSTIQASPGSVTCSWTASSGDLWDDVAIELKSAGGSNVPSTPTNANSTAISTTQLQLKWTAPSNNGGTAITGYKIQQKTDTSSWFTLKNNTGTTVTNYNVTGLVANSAFTFHIAAWNRVGLGAYSANVTGDTLPAPPTNLAASAVSSSQINISWNVSGNATTGFKIERSPDGTNWSTIVSNTGSATTTYSDTGLAASTTYYYRVSTINPVGTSSPSGTASATTSAKASTGIMIPLYIYPDSGHPHSGWDNVTNAKTTHPGVPIAAIINPDSGFPLPPDNMTTDCTSQSYVSDYQTGTTNLKNAGVLVLGYVYTNYGSRSSTQIEQEIDHYKNCMPAVKGILFDEMNNGAGAPDKNYYGNLTKYAKVNDGMTYTVGNPGTSTDSGYVGTVDNIAIYENAGLPSASTLQTSTFNGTYEKGNFTFVSYGVPSSNVNQTVITNDSNYVGYLYVTDNTGCSDHTFNCWNNPNCVYPSCPNQYNTTSSYLNRTATYLAP